HLAGTFVVGMAFGAGWSPCIGPLLGSILIVAGNQETLFQGIWLLAFYSAGLALPFILMSVFITSLMTVMKKATRYIGIINKTAGTLLIFMGLLLIFDKFHLLIFI
ncbi:MAG TPA: cytochrome c biogenesis protein CcdA, partial [Desulfotignum sp.]|nr:cytochrome c biogenesis protein CcdA [Desulfotignum sp.]